MKKSNAVNFDTTFYVDQKLFYQLFTIFLQGGHHAMPAIHGLMSKRSESLHAVLKNVIELMPDFKLKLSVGDYEKASRNSFRTAFNSIEVSGYLVHFSKAIWKKLTKLHLSSTYAKKSKFNGWIRTIMVLPMSPEEEIRIRLQIAI